MMEDIKQDVPVGSEPLDNIDHEEFCHQYIRTRNVAESGRLVGWKSRQNAHIVYKMSVVQERIAYLKQELFDELGLDDYYVLKNLKSIAERCMQAEAVTDREGEPVLVEDVEGELKPVYRFDAQGAIKANELIGKHIGMFVEQKKINVEVDLMSELIDEISTGE